MKYKISLTVVFLSAFLCLGTTFTNAKTIQSNLEYPDNHKKSFVEVNSFYKEIESKVYEEYPNATFSYRKMVRFKEVSDAITTFEQKAGIHRGEDKNRLVASHVHPNRQVYVLATFYQNEKKEYHKFIVYDAETKNVLAKGNGEKTFVNPYEKTEEAN